MRSYTESKSIPKRAVGWQPLVFRNCSQISRSHIAMDDVFHIHRLLQDDERAANLQPVNSRQRLGIHVYLAPKKTVQSGTKVSQSLPQRQTLLSSGRADDFPVCMPHFRIMHNEIHRDTPDAQPLLKVT